MKEISFGRIPKLAYARREAINTLKTNMLFAGVNVKTVVLTSTSQGEGKSTISFDLACTLTESGKNVLYIDADLRKSQHINTLRIKTIEDDTIGLTHYLAGTGDIKNLVCRTNINNLYMIMTGTYSANPTELLASERFSQFIEKVSQLYDYVVIDSPPLGAVIDAAIIAPLTDGVIIVVEADKTPTKSVQNVAKQIESSGAKILGYVLNKISIKSNPYYSKYKYYGKEE